MKSLNLVLVVLAVALAGCSSSDSSQNSSNDPELAISLVAKVCDGTNDLDWAERAKLAAQANFLDSRWQRLADATYYQSAAPSVAKAVETGKNYSDYPEPALATVYEQKIQYAKFVAECSILDIAVGNNK